MNDDKKEEKKGTSPKDDQKDGEDKDKKSEDSKSEEDQKPLNGIDAELDRIDKAKKPRTEKEKAAFALQQNAKRAKELGLNPEEILGFKKNGDPIFKENEDEDDDDDSKPVTRGDLKAMEARRATKTALEMADDIEDPKERELAKYYLENSIKPSGNAKEDLRLARNLVNSAKHAQIAGEVDRTKKPKTAGSGSGAPAKGDEVIELTGEEKKFLGAPWFLSEKEILDSRPKAD